MSYFPSRAALSTIAAQYRPLKAPTTVVTTAFSTSPTFTGVDWIPWASAAGKYRFVGMTPVALASDATYAINNNNTLANSNSLFQSVTVEFWSNATEIRFYGYTATEQPDMWATVDDMPIVDGTFTHMSNFNGIYSWSLTQSTTGRWRKWRLCTPTFFSGIGVSTGAKIVPTTPGFQLAVYGDSWVQGNITTANAVSAGVTGLIIAGNICGELAKRTGMDVWSFGVGGTGYVSAPVTNSAYGSTQRVNALAAAGAMDAVLVIGTANDNASTPATVVAAANPAWTALKAAQPNAPLIVAGIEDVNQGNAALTPLNTALIAAAKAHPKVHAVMDIRTKPITTGTGYDGAPANDGNGDVMLASDSLHPTHQGAVHISGHFARRLGAVPIAVGSY